MSASNKKKLRKEQNVAALTEKQRMQQKEAKKLKAYSITFVVIMLAVIITAVAVMGFTAFKNSGITERNTIAAVVNEHEISSVEMTYYYKDAISNTYNEWYSSYGDSTAQIVTWMLNLDLSKPLGEQEYPEGGTWADHFMNMALENAKSNYAIYDLAKSEGYTLSEDEQTALDENLNYMNMYATMYGYNNLTDYLRMLYGNGANEKSYKDYMTRSSIATAYYNDHYDTLTYEDADIRAYEEDKFNNYSSYNYALYYVDNDAYLTGGTKDEEGKVTYSDEEKGAAIELAYADSEALLSATNLEELNAAIAALAINAEKEGVKANESNNVLYSNLDEVFSKWLSDVDRKENDITSIADEKTETNDDGNEVTTVEGYHVLMFLSRNDNTDPMANVRHLLVQFEGGTQDDEGNVTYSDEEKAAAKKKADDLLKTWNEGEATEESFIALVKEHSADEGSVETGGLYENINRDSSYVPNFLNWSIDADRKTGDCEVVETEYGYHIMYFVGNSKLSYRDQMITDDLRTEDLEAWYNEVVGSYTSAFRDISRMETNLTISEQA